MNLAVRCKGKCVSYDTFFSKAAISVKCYMIFEETLSSPHANYVQSISERKRQTYTLPFTSHLWKCRFTCNFVCIRKSIHVFTVQRNRISCIATHSPSCVCCLFFCVNAIFKCGARLMCFIIRTYSIQAGYVQCAVCRHWNALLCVYLVDM